jgi:hypothetical protein
MAWKFTSTEVGFVGDGVHAILERQNVDQRLVATANTQQRAGPKERLRTCRGSIGVAGLT